MQSSDLYSKVFVIDADPETWATLFPGSAKERATPMPWSGSPKITCHTSVGLQRAVDGRCRDTYIGTFVPYACGLG